MVPLVCPTCRTESPEGSRFCSMCGQPLSGSSSVRASSPDRRVQTSPVGTVLPSEVLSALSAASSGAHRAALSRDSGGSRGSAVVSGMARGDETARIERDVRSSAKPVRGVPRQATDDPTLPVRYRPTRKGKSARLLRSFLFGALWLLLAGLVAMVVVWVLPERETSPSVSGLGAPPKQPASATKTPGSATDVGRAGRPSARTNPLAVTPGAQTAQRPAAPTTIAAPTVPPPSVDTSPTPVEPPRTTPSDSTESLLSGAARAAWQQDAANVEFVARTYAAQIRSCYERAVHGLPGDAPRGRVIVLFSLSDEGWAQNPVTSEDSLGLPVLGNCLTRRVAEWRFPRPVGPIRTFRLPFEFAGTLR